MLTETVDIMIIFLLISISAAAVVPGDFSKFCNRPECDPSHEPVPNIFTAMTGYNILKGNPLPQGRNVIKDPGFDNMEYIFIPTVKNGENRYALDDGLSVRTITSCQTALETEIVTNTNDYQKSLKKVSSQGNQLATNLESEVSVSIPVKAAEVGVKTTVPPLAASAYGANNVFKKNERFFTSKTGIVVNARAHCVIYTVKVSQTRPPKFHPGFINMLKELQAANDASDNVKNEKAKRLITNFGTHYLRNADMGARISISKRYDRNEAMKTTEEEMKECTKSSLNLFFGLVNTASSKCTKTIESRDSRWTSEYNREYITSFGSKPKKDLITWADQDFTSPIPIRMELDPILNLFRGVFMDGLEETIEYKKILKWLGPKYLKYCEDNKSELQIASCDVASLKAKGCGWNDDCDFDQVCKNDKTKPEGYVCNNPERTYDIKVKTSDVSSAGTNADVKITLFDVDGQSSREVSLDNDKDNFERDDEDRFSFKTKRRIGELKKIRMRHDNAGHKPGWHLQWVKVRDVLRERTYEFPCNRWLSRSDDDERIDIECYEKSRANEWNKKKKKGRNYN